MCGVHIVVEKRVHFGLGEERDPSVVEITWPGGQVQKLQNVPVDQILKVGEPG